MSNAIYVGARVEGTRVVFSIKDGNIRVAIGNPVELVVAIRKRFHLYSVSNDLKFLTLEAGDLQVEHAGPEELDLLPEHTAGIQAVVKEIKNAE